MRLIFWPYYCITMIKLIDYYKSLVIDFSALNFWCNSFAAESATVELSFGDGMGDGRSHVATKHGTYVSCPDMKFWQPVPTSQLLRLENDHQYALASIAHRLLVREGIGVFNAGLAQDMAFSFFAPFEYSPEELYIDGDLKKIREAGDYSYIASVGMAWELWLIKTNSDHPQSGILAQIREAVARLSQAPPEWFMPEGLDMMQPIDIYGECDLDIDGLSKPVRKWLDGRVETLISRAHSTNHEPQHSGRCEDAPCCGCCD